jgi:NAD(P)-dependent dehydrogenase (short-subunit alcohol dehydrogenase family)
MMEQSAGCLAIVFGATGGIGTAIAEALAEGGRFNRVLCLSRYSDPPVDILDEDSISAAAAFAVSLALPVRLVIVATGVLKSDEISPEKSWRDLDPATLAKSFALNTIGPALILKHFLPLLPRDGRSVFAALSARVGSIGDNRLGGWYGYRASKTALNQLIRTASIELGRTRPDAICVALHPGTVETTLSAPFIKSGLDIQSPRQSADRLIEVMGQLSSTDTGQFFDHLGKSIPW